ncbi:MAG: hypothetical protein JWN48_2405 [Myxococcaceae bacterium]|nr:hypothetical protein [Myxococcaceae bacterium]
MENLKKQPRRLAVYTVIPQADGKDSYLRVGGGLAEAEGDSFHATLVLDAIPLSGKLVVRSCEPADRTVARRRAVGLAV